MQSFPALLCSVLACVVFASCATKARKSEATALVVASDLDNRPFAWVDEQGHPRGRDVEMMESLARSLGREIEWRRMSFSALLPAAESGEVDVVCATIGITSERAQRVLFTQPYFTTEIALIIRSDAAEPRTFADLDGRRVLAGKGTTSELAVRTRLPRAICVVEVKADMSTEERLLAHDVDAAALDGPAAQARVLASQGLLARLPESLCAERYALALPKSKARLREALDSAIERMTARGEMRALDERYGLHPIAASTR